MANKKQTELFKKQEKEKRFLLALEDVKLFPWLVATACALAILLYFLNFSAVYNADINGNEISATGFHYALAALTNGFSRANASLYGSVDFFNYWVPAPTVITGVAAAVGLIGGVAALVLSAVTALTKKYGLSLFALIAAAVSFLAVLVSFIAALSAGPAMIAGYCSGNPKCSLTSLAFLPALLFAAATGLACFVFIRYQKARSLLA